jgi:hypothetical protein
MLLKTRLRNTSVLLTAGLLGAAIVSGCGGSGFSHPPPTIAKTAITSDPVINLTEQDNRVGAWVGLTAKLVISLPIGNGGGTPWQLTDSVGPQLQQLSARSTAGTQVFAFRAVKTGEETVRLHNGQTGADWYTVVEVWTINLSPKNFVPPGAGVTSPTGVTSPRG